MIKIEQLIICETNNGRYTVRPINWAGTWNEKGQINEHLNHRAIFSEKEEAEKFVKWKMTEEQNRLLTLPVVVDDVVYTFSFYNVLKMRVECFIVYKDHIDVRISSKSKENSFLTVDIDIAELGKRWFLTEYEAATALQKSQEKS